VRDREIITAPAGRARSCAAPGRPGWVRAARGRHRPARRAPRAAPHVGELHDARSERIADAGQRGREGLRGHDEGPPVVNKFVNDQVDIAKSLEAIATTMFEQGRTDEAVYTLMSALLAEVRAMRAEASQERNWVIDGIVNLQKTLA
jgi:hypothetical protein